MGFNLKKENSSGTRGFNLVKNEDTAIPLKTTDGKSFGNVTYNAVKAIENNTLDSYTPANDDEKKVLDKYKTYTGYGKTFETVKKQYDSNKFGKGNIDLTNRPRYVNPDGKISTVSSIGINEDGKEIVIPTIVKGSDGKAKRLTDEKAIQHYHKTGEYLGKFNTIEEANNYAQSLHIDQELYYSVPENTRNARNANLWDNTVNSFKKGWIQSLYGQEAYKDMTGQKNNKDYYKQMLDSEDYSFIPDNWFEKAISGASELLGQQVKQWTDPSSIAAGTAAAGAVAIAGQAGPQIAVPEEIITVPGAFAAGMAAGSATANFEIEAGNAYEEMIENGISPSLASKIALGVGGVNAALEMVQADDLIKSFKILNKSKTTKPVAKKVLSYLKDRGINVASETAQEVGQEASTIIGAQAANKIEKGKFAYDSGEVARRLGETAASSALSFGLLGIGGDTVKTNVVSGINNINTIKTGKQLQEFKSDVIQTGLESPKESEAYKNAEKLSQKKRISNMALGKQFYKNVEQINAENKQAKDNTINQPKTEQKTQNNSIIDNTANKIKNNVFTGDIDEAVQDGALQMFAPKNANKAIKEIEMVLIEKGATDSVRQSIIENAINVEKNLHDTEITVGNVLTGASNLTTNIAKKYESTIGKTANYWNLYNTNLQVLSEPDNVITADYIKSYADAFTSALQINNPTLYQGLTQDGTDLSDLLVETLVTGTSTNAIAQMPPFLQAKDMFVNIINDSITQTANGHKALYGDNEALIAQRNAALDGDYSAILNPQQKAEPIAEEPQQVPQSADKPTPQTDTVIEPVEQSVKATEEVTPKEDITPVETSQEVHTEPKQEISQEPKEEKQNISLQDENKNGIIETEEYTITKDVDTRDNSDLWVVKPKNRLSKEEFATVKNEMRKIGGYYSKFKKGFIFKENPSEKLGITPDEKKAINNADSNVETSVETAPKAEQETETVKEPATEEKAETITDNKGKKEPQESEESESETIEEPQDSDTQEESAESISDELTTITHSKNIYAAFKGAKQIVEGKDCITDGFFIVPKTETAMEKVQGYAKGINIEKRDNLTFDVVTKGNMIPLVGDPKVCKYKGKDIYVFKINDNYYACEQKYLNAVNNGKNIIKASIRNNGLISVEDKDGNLIAGILPLHVKDEIKNSFDTFKSASDIISENNQHKAELDKRLFTQNEYRNLAFGRRLYSAEIDGDIFATNGSLIIKVTDEELSDLQRERNNNDNILTSDKEIIKSDSLSRTLESFSSYTALGEVAKPVTQKSDYGTYNTFILNDVAFVFDKKYFDILKKRSQTFKIESTGSMKSIILVGYDKAGVKQGMILPINKQGNFEVDGKSYPCVTGALIKDMMEKKPHVTKETSQKNSNSIKEEIKNVATGNEHGVLGGKDETSNGRIRTDGVSKENERRDTGEALQSDSGHSPNAVHDDAERGNERSDREPVSGRKEEIDTTGNEERTGTRKPMREGDGRGSNEREHGNGIEEQGEKQSKKNKLSNKNSHKITDEQAQELDTTKPNLDDNFAAIELLTKIEEEARPATKEEKTILAKFKGWGGVNLWEHHEKRRKLQSMLTTDEFRDAESSTLTAFFTPLSLVDEMYNGLKRMGFKGGNILEPSMGTGNFFGRMPNTIKQNSTLHGVEMENITARISKMLYPEAEIANKTFQDATYAHNSFDLAIGNVPFNNTKYKYDKGKYKLNDYFFVKTIDALKEGGILAFITNSGTLDNLDIKARAKMFEKADMIAAYKLPAKVFTRNANTDVQTDLIIMRKRKAGELPTGEAFINVSTNDDGIRLNEYFINHPENILGTLTQEKNQWGQVVTNVTGAENFNAVFKKAMSRLPKNLISGEFEINDVISETDGVMRSKFYEDNGMLMFKDENGKSSKVSASHVPVVKMYLSLVNDYSAVLNAGKNNLNAEQRAALREELNVSYDNFVSKYDNISKQKNAKILKEDVNFNLVTSLEVYDSKAKQYKKSEIFTKDTIVREKPTKADSANEALAISINETGQIDFDRMCELTNKTQEQIVDELQDSIIITPDGRYELIDVYLSGNVREKLKQVEGKKDFSKNEKLLKSVLPKDKVASDIDTKLGAPFIEPRYINGFIREVFNERYDVFYTPTVGSWTFEYMPQSIFGSLMNEKYGTSRMHALKILDCVLNQRNIEVFDKDNDGNKFINNVETEAARQKGRDIQEAFNDWIFKDTDRRSDIVKKYNELYNSIVPMNYDKLAQYITFPNKSDNIVLRNYQKRSVARVIFGGNTLFAHGVGVGKTFEMIASAMELKRMGIVKKTLMVVPNNKIGDFKQDILKLYPGAKVLQIETKDRRKNLAKIHAQDWDIVLTGHTTFGMIGVSNEVQRQYIVEELEQIDDEIAVARNDRNVSKRQLKTLIDKRMKYSAKIEELLQNTKRDTDNLYLEDLNIDCLVVDEAHNFKNVPTITKLDIKGLANSNASDRASDMIMKLNYLHSIGSRVLFGTATPITNTVAEIYNMTKMVAPDVLKNAGIQSFDSWVGMFANVEGVREIDATGKPKNKITSVVKNFVNANEMISLFRNFADVINTEDVVKDLPKGDFIDIICKSTPFHKDIMQYAAGELASIGGGKDALAKHGKINSLMSNASIDLRMLKNNFDGFSGISESELDVPTSKINKSVEQTLKIYKETMKEKGTQLIFCSGGMGTGKIYNFNCHDDIVQKLVDGGIPKEQIAKINDYDPKKEDKLNELFDKLRSGEIRVLIGSSMRMGEGLNVQDRLAAIHHITVPFKPSELEQMNGRGVRHGNLFKNVKIFRYIQEDTYDAYKWQAIARKQEFIKRALAGEAITTLEDVGETEIDAKTAMAIASGNPLLIDKMNIDDEVTKQKRLKKHWQDEQYSLQEKIARYPQKINTLELMNKKLQQDIQTRNSNTSDKFNITIGNKDYDKQSTAGKALVETVKKIPKNGKERIIGKYNGFELAYIGSMSNDNKLILKGRETYTIEYGSSELGNITRLTNVLKGLENRVAENTKIIEALQKDLKIAKDEYGKPYEKQKALDDALEKQKQIQYEYDHYGEKKPQTNNEDYSIESDNAGTFEEINNIFLPKENDVKTFMQQINNWKTGNMLPTEVFNVCHTSTVLKCLGAKDLPIVMPQNVMVKITGEKHNISLDEIKQLPNSIAEPIMVFKSATVSNAFILLTELVDKNGKDVVVALHLDKHQDRLNVNRIASVYGKNSILNFIRQQISQDNLMYIDKNKSQQWSTSRGLQLPELVQSITDNNNILQKEDIVNTYYMQKNKNNSIESEGNYEQGNNIVLRNGERGDNARFGEQIKRLSSNGETLQSRQAYAEQIYKDGGAKTTVIGNIQADIVAENKYNADMRSIAESNKEKGFTTHFFVGNGKYKFLNGITVNGIHDGNDIYIRYDGNTAPQIINAHELAHVEYNTEKMKSIKDTILGGLTEQQNKRILSSDRYKKYMYLYNGNIDKVLEEYVCDVVSGLYDNGSYDRDILTLATQTNGKQNYNINEYIASIDVGKDIESIGYSDGTFDKNNSDIRYSLDVSEELATLTQEAKEEIFEQFERDNVGVVKESAKEIWERRRDWAIHNMTRVFPDIPERGEAGAHYAEFRKMMVQWKALPQTSMFMAQHKLNQMTKDLSRPQFKTFSKLVYFLDLQEEAKIQKERGYTDIVLPNNITPYQVDEVVKTLKQEADETVVNALAKRKEIWDLLKKQYVEFNRQVGFDTSNKFMRENYYHHQVIEYMADNKDKGTGSYDIEIKAGRGWLKERQGSNKAINTDFLAVEYRALLQMQYDVYIAHTLSEIKSRYDVKPQLEKAAYNHNKEMVERLIAKEATGPDGKLMLDDKGNPDSDIYRQQKWFNQRIAFGFSQLDALAAINKLPALNGYNGVIKALAVKGHNSPGLFSYLGTLASMETTPEIEEAQLGARIVLKYVSQKKAWIKELLGKDYETWESLAKQDDTLAIHQPRRGNYFYTKEVINEEAFNEAFNNMVLSLTAGQNGIETTQTVKDLFTQYSDTLRLKGAAYEQWVLPKIMVSTMDSLANPKKIGETAKFARSIQNSWKGWSTSINPRRTIKFGIRNITGDLDSVIAGNPKIVKYSGRAIKEIHRAMKNKEYSPEIMEWIERGGYSSLLFANEMDADTKNKLFSHLLDKEGINVFKIPAKIVEKYSDGVEYAHNFREAILRYSAYLYYKDNINKNGGTVKDYAASNRHIVDGLETVEDKAYQLSKDLLGAYDEVNATGQTLRRYFIPFYSFTETNIKRYYRLFANIIASNDNIPKKAAKLLLKTLSVNALALILLAWNRLVQKESDDKLPESAKNVPHITFGSNGNKAYAFTRLGSFSELLEWFGLEDYSFEKDDLSAPVDKAWSMITPFAKMPIEFMTGLNFYPSITKPRAIRDKAEHFFNNFGLADEYKIAAGKPNKGFGNMLIGSVIYSYDIEESAYNDFLATKRKYQNKTDNTIYGTTDKSNALYYMKSAVKYKDEKAALKYLDKYFKYGGTAKGIVQSFNMLDPMYGYLSKDSIEKGKQFVASLTPEEKEDMKLAQRYYEKNLKLPDEVTKYLKNKNIAESQAVNVLKKYIYTTCNK